MPRPYRTDPETDELWQQFHDCVNVDSGELRRWLMTRGSGEEAFDAPERLMSEPGKSILAVLGKRKVDLTDRDRDVMRRTVDQVQDLLAARPAVGVTDEQWRHDLMDLGHDPVREV